MLRRRIGLVTALLVLVPTTGARAASIWTPVATGLPASDLITAVAWPNANEVVLATGSGRILHGSLSGLTAASVMPAVPTGFNDISMSPDGTKGDAVGTNGLIYRSTDSGASWARIGAPVEYSNTECSASPSTTAPSSGPLSDDLLTVRFADSGTVYATGRHRDVLKSTDGGATFTEVNKKSDGTCLAPGLTGDFTGQQWLDANHGYMIDNQLGQYYTTISGFAAPLTKQSDSSVSLGRARLAIDPTTPSHAWAISDGHQNASYFQLTTDNGGTWRSPAFDDNQVSLQDIAFSGGTVVAVGQGGDIYTSPDGRTFNRQIADAPLSTNGWQAVAMLDATHALVGGAGGALLTTTKANSAPSPTPPASQNPAGSSPTAPTSGSVPGTTAPAQQPASSSRAATSDGKTVAVTITCVSACVVTITITAPGATKATVIATGKVSLRARGHRAVKVKLTRAGRRLLKRHHGKLTARIVLQTRTAGHPFTTSHALRIVSGKRKR